MAETSSAADFTSSTAYSNNSYEYDVFLNHRGPDVKKTFASHLYRRLLSHGIRPFLDQPELEPGDYLTPQIEGAIRSASVQVAIFSRGYAESAWCLNELVLMRESNSLIIPVFYNVKPSELRWTRGKVGIYGEALAKLEEKQRYNSSTIESWKNALSNVAGISGFELEACNGDEGELVDKVVEQVLKKVKKTALDVAKYPTGLDDKLNDFQNTALLERHESGKPQILGIVGLGGVGKTTLAKEFFNRKNSNYSRSCFLFDVRDHANKGSLNSLQRELVKSLTGSDKQIVSVDEGIGILKKHMSSPNVLVILDDVDKEDQVYALLPGLTVLDSDSLILITSRSKDVLQRSGVVESSIYNLTGLTTQHSLELFCLHSFNQPHPLREFESLVKEFLEACGGLPLSLKVFGALLYGKDTSYWKDQLDKLQRILPEEIKQRLQISYDALDKEEQHIFLDIACFFIGEDRDMVIKIWDNGLCGFQNIQNKCLVEVNSAKKIRMHDHVRDLGREIAKAPGLPRRLWRWTENDIDYLLQQSSVIPVRGIRMVPREYNDIDDDDAFGRMRRLQLLDTEGVLLERILTKVQSPNLKWLRWKKCPYSSLPSWISMKNLRVLQVGGDKLETLWKEELKTSLPLQLRELKIDAPLSDIPKSIGQLKYLEQIVISHISGRMPTLRKLPEEFCHLQSLKALVLRACIEIKSLPECFGNLNNLRHIDLSHCHALETMPECFGNLNNLRHIDLSYCHALETLPDSFGHLINLQYLELENCVNLSMSSKTLGNITTLEYLDLNFCVKIEVFPPQVAHQWSLEQLHLAFTNIKELPDAIGELSDLEILEVGSPLLETLPASLGDLRNLKKLSIRGCTELKCLPASIGHLTKLTELRVDNSPLIRELPFKKEDSSIDNWILPRLQRLSVSRTGISEVSFAEGVCFNLRQLSISGCDNLKKIENLYGLTKLRVLSLSWCKEVEELPNMETVPSLRTLGTMGCVKLKSIRGLGSLTKLEVLNVEGCSKLEELPNIETLVSLRMFTVSECVKLKSIRGLGQLTKLEVLNVEGCSKLEELPNIETLVSLRKFTASECVKLKSIRGLGQLTKLPQLDVRGCSELEEVEGIQDCVSLGLINAYECPKLQLS